MLLLPIHRQATQSRHPLFLQGCHHHIHNKIPHHTFSNSKPLPSTRVLPLCQVSCGGVVLVHHVSVHITMLFFLCGCLVGLLSVCGVSCHCIVDLTTTALVLYNWTARVVQKKSWIKDGLLMVRLGDKIQYSSFYMLIWWLFVSVCIIFVLKVH